MSSVKVRMIEHAKNQGDNKSVMCRKINMSLSGFKGHHLEQGVNTDSVATYVSVYSTVDIYWLLNISDVLEEKKTNEVAAEDDEVYKTDAKKEENPSHNETMIEMLNRNNISLTETNKYLLKKLQENEKDS